MIIKETLTKSNFTYDITAKSKITGEQITVAVRMKCPNRRCRTDLSDIGHGITSHCPKCGLKMTAWGNMLECEIEEENFISRTIKIINGMFKSNV